MSDRKHRNLIIGLQSIVTDDEQVDCRSYPWSKLDKLPPIRDFDRVVVNLTSATLKDIDWDVFFNIFNPLSMMDVIAHGGMFMIIGDPVFTCELENGSEREFLWWTGLDFTWNKQGGESVEVKDKRYFESYYALIGKWTFSLKGVQITQNLMNAFRGVFKESGEPTVSVYSRVANRNGEQLVFDVEIGFSQKRGRQDKKHLGEFGFFPSFGSRAEDVVAEVLKGAFNFTISAEPPKWLEKIAVPNQQIIDDEIKKLEKQTSSIEKEIARKRKERKKIREPIEILYQSGTSLEEAVERLFKQLGARFLKSEEGADDGCFRVKVGEVDHHVVLEIKSTEKATVNEQGFKQILQWKNNLLIDRGEKFKGVLVVNSLRVKHPNSRTSPFNESLTKKAEKAEVALVSTKDIFAYFVAVEEGRISQDEFWQALIQVNGEVLPPAVDGQKTVNLDR